MVNKQVQNFAKATKKKKTNKPSTHSWHLSLTENLMNKLKDYLVCNDKCRIRFNFFLWSFPSQNKYKISTDGLEQRIKCQLNIF